MLVGRSSSELSGHKLQGKLKKSQPPSEADLSRRAGEGPAVQRASRGNVYFDRAHDIDLLIWQSN